MLDGKSKSQLSCLHPPSVTSVTSVRPQSKSLSSIDSDSMERKFSRIGGCCVEVESPLPSSLALGVGFEEPEPSVLMIAGCVDSVGEISPVKRELKNETVGEGGCLLELAQYPLAPSFMGVPL